MNVSGEKEPSARLFDLYRGTTHDGPGVRDTVFFKGCPLACEWCHNPEGIGPAQQVWLEPRSCAGCMSCLAVCPRSAIKERNGSPELDRSLCAACGVCVRECPTGAMTFVARDQTLSGLLSEVLRDEAYYRSSGGGVTASGGECLTQHEFVAAFFRELRARGVHTALDTSGFAPCDAFLEALAETDCLLLDIKLFDPAAHKKFTGADNRPILENAIRAAETARSGRARPLEIWIRTPLIPGATATAENIRSIGGFIASELRGAVSRWELCAFNSSCTGKYRRLGLEWSFAGTPLLWQSEADTLLHIAKETGAADGEVCVTGVTAEG